MTKQRSYRAQPFDLMQYLYGAVHAPLIHAMIRLSGQINEKALKEAVTRSADFLPLLRCSFEKRGTRPRWYDRGFTGDDIVEVIQETVQNEAAPGKAEKLLAAVPDLTREPPLKIFVLRGQTADTLCVIISHLICDGAGFKEYLYLLSKLFTAVLNHEKSEQLTPAPRGIGQVFSAFSLGKKVKIATSKSFLKNQKTSAAFTLQGDKSNPFFVTHQIGRENFAQIRNYAKEHGATVNDMILTAYARALAKSTGEEQIAFPCPVDLRKYLRPQKPHGICNLTSNYVCAVTVKDGNAFTDTLLYIAQMMNKQKSEDSCLKPVLLLDILFHLLPYSTLQRLFYKIFTIPRLSYTNLGVVDKKQLVFSGLDIVDLYLTGAVKYVPYFQIAASSFDGVLTLSSNLHGTGADRKKNEAFLAAVENELMQQNDGGSYEAFRNSQA